MGVQAREPFEVEFDLSDRTFDLRVGHASTEKTDIDDTDID